MRKAMSVGPEQETDFFGRPLVQAELPETDGIKAGTTVPQVGQRVCTEAYGCGEVLSVGERAYWGDTARSIEVRFDGGEKWFVAMRDLIGGNQ